MTLTEDIKNLQQQGFSDEQIIQSLREKNVSYREIADALAQSRIKAAVEDPNTEPQNAFPAPSPSEEYAGTRPMEGMEPSIMATESNQRPELTAPSPTYADTPSPQEYGQQYADSYAQYAQQPQSQQGASPDLIAEIADQIMTEKLGDIRKHLEKIIDMKTTFDSKIEYVDERLKKIEEEYEEHKHHCTIFDKPSFVKEEIRRRHKTPGQKEGHKGYSRHIPERIDYIKPHIPNKCPDCNTKLVGKPKRKRSRKSTCLSLWMTPPARR